MRDYQRYGQLQPRNICDNFLHFGDWRLGATPAYAGGANLGLIASAF
jgi:hypothetical protein